MSPSQTCLDRTSKDQATLYQNIIWKKSCYKSSWVLYFYFCLKILQKSAKNMEKGDSEQLLEYKAAKCWSKYTIFVGVGVGDGMVDSRLYIIRRLQNHLSKKAVRKVVDGLFTSKLRYGLQLYGKVRSKESDPECEDFKAIQLVQNNLLRALNGSSVKDMVSISLLLKKFEMLSVNQLNAQMKLVEIWKAFNVIDYLLKIKQQSSDISRTSTRADSMKKPIEIGKSNLVQKTCVSDAIRLWNMAPLPITNCTSLNQAKSEIKKFVRLLPI